MAADIATWSITALATLAIMIRPWRWSEAVWAVGGAIALVAATLVPWRAALAAVAQGTDVYLFLVGMMLLAELARTQGLFDWLAAVATRAARGSSSRLFTLIYLVGVIVTVFLSNDATAVVLTPAVYAAARRAGAEPLPFLFICAFVANAASFVLPISNPANLVVFDGHVPALEQWLARFALPSALSILATFVILRVSQRRSLIHSIASDAPMPPLTLGARLTALGIAATAAVLMAANAAGLRLGAPTFAAGVVTVAIVLARVRQPPWAALKGVHWTVLPLVAGLFVLVEGLRRSGVLSSLGAVLNVYAHRSGQEAAWCAGAAAAIASNAFNNLPVALIARSASASVPGDPSLGTTLLLGVDLGPNLAVTGSLATILWLTALRREGQHVSAATFLRLGMLVMPATLLLALASTLPR